MKKCIKCGNMMQDNEKYCTNCDSLLEVISENYRAEDVSGKSRRNCDKKKFGLAGILAVIFGVAAVFFGAMTIYEWNQYNDIQNYCDVLIERDFNLELKLCEQAEEYASLQEQAEWMDLYGAIIDCSSNNNLYHTYTCSNIDWSSGLVYIDSTSAATNAGYEPCPDCHSVSSSSEVENYDTSQQLIEDPEMSVETDESTGMDENADYISEDVPIVEDTTNTFIGTINGKEVIGYLDKTYVYYLGGKDYNACFVTFDKNGAPEYDIYFCINKDVETGTYSSSGQYDDNKVHVTVYTELEETNLKWDDSYSFKTSDKAWSFELTRAEYSDDGVFEGTIEGTCAPGYYNNSPSYTEVTISGSFNFQMQTIHPTMETYRAEHSDYNDAQAVSYVQSYGTPTNASASGSGSSSSDGNSSTVDHTCRTCNGTGLCQLCGGDGLKRRSVDGKVSTCVRCNGSGKCTVCYGTGTVY